MFDRMQTLSAETLDDIHNATLNVLSPTGVAFFEPDALALFKSHGFRVDDKVVSFSEKQVQTSAHINMNGFKC